jgi:hypothetical protein
MDKFRVHKSNDVFSMNERSEYKATILEGLNLINVFIIVLNKML